MSRKEERITIQLQIKNLKTRLAAHSRRECDCRNDNQCSRSSLEIGTEIRRLTREL